LFIGQERKIGKFFKNINSPTWDDELVGIDDEVDQKSEETEIIGAYKTGAVEKFFIIQQRDLSLHFLDCFCDWHKFFFWFRVLIIVNA
jgi:hypothetical protein